MPELCNTVLVESLATALETMAFVSILPPDGDVRPPHDAILISISFHGVQSGRVDLVASPQLGRLLVDNTLACDPSDSLILPNPQDPLVELLNITCGALLKQRKPSCGRFEMAVPTVTAFDIDHDWAAFTADGMSDVLLADGNVIAIRMTEE